MSEVASHRLHVAAPSDGDLRTIRVAGCDLGKSTAKFVLATAGRDGSFDIDSMAEVLHEGRPLEAFLAWYQQKDVSHCAALGATGLYAKDLAAGQFQSLPEEACLSAALPVALEPEGPLNLVIFGARGYRVLSRSSDGRIRFLENEKCSSGTGETIVKIAGRFGLTITEADRLAGRAQSAIPITARCSVFAKSEMTHFGNQGKPMDALFRGYFKSVAQYAAALLKRTRVEGPVYVAGGGSLLDSLVAALSEYIEQEVHKVEHPLHIEAIGAAMLVGQQALSDPPEALPVDIAELIRPTKERLTALEPAGKWSHLVTRLEASLHAPDAATMPAVLGLDLGSTGAKATLVNIDSGDLVASLYDRTQGNPVEATRRLIEMLLAQAAPDVRAIGLTGSGREAAATVARAAFPEAADRIVVENEIVAHATAAIRCDPQSGKSLSVVEIGGQDAKYIEIRDGRIVQSDMNQACSAGTGSFLEEQAVFYGVDNIEDFSRIAARATRPPDLGQMCTVFVADAAAEAQSEGFDTADIFAGFQYSVIHNYINRVMGRRRLGDRISFQGKPAAGPSLGWTLAAVTGRKVIVPPDPGAMGAWGIGLCTLAACNKETLLGSAPVDLEALRAARVVATDEFRCEDEKCATLCIIQRTDVEVHAQRRTVISGGACPKYERAGAGRRKLPKQAPNAFDERQALLAPFTEPIHGDRTVAIPNVSSAHGYLPWLVTFVKHLGLGVQCLESDSEWLTRGEQRCFSYDACSPVKIMHGLPSVDVDAVFAPKLISYADRDSSAGRSCPMEQALPEMVRDALAASGQSMEFVHPKLSFHHGLAHRSLCKELRRAAVRLGADPRKVPGAVRKAAEAQQRYWAELAAIGNRSLQYARRHGIAAVVVCGPLHVIHQEAINAGIPRLLRRQGVIAVPVDCFEIPADVPRMPRIVWSESNRILRSAVAARQRGDVYPLLLSSFGCGPASFLEQVFGHLMEDYPHTVLESDGHGGTAGYITRIEAFLHAVGNHDRRESPVPDERLESLSRVSDRPLEQEKDSRLVVFSLGDRISSHIAAVYRSLGFDAVPSGPIDAEALAAGRRDCSGKECFPYHILWSSFKNRLDRNANGKPATLVQFPGQGMCRNCMFSLKDEISLQRLGLSHQVSLRHFSAEIDFSWTFAMKGWAATVVWGILFQLAAYCRPLARDPARVDELYRSFNDELEAIIERPSPRGLLGLLAFLKAGPPVHDLAERASAAFAGISDRGDPHNDYRRVLLSGDVYLRLDEFASDRLIRRLNERGLHVIVEPASLLTEYMAHQRLGELMGLPTDWMNNLIIKWGMAAVRRDLYGRVRRRHPWLPPTETTAMLKATSEALDQHPVGEAPVTIGSVLHHWRKRDCDGVVLISPWGCGPALVAESLLSHRDEIPTLLVYIDGSPIDERRLDAFTFKLRQSPSRTVRSR